MKAPCIPSAAQTYAVDLHSEHNLNYLIRRRVHLLMSYQATRVD
jgi:hypothetical protein